MKLQPSEIFEEYEAGVQHKQSIGKHGISEQNKINERFFIGDQWHGAKCGNDRPLVRYNIIKRIGDYKMSQILNVPLTVNFSVDGIPSYEENDILDKIPEGSVSDSEINSVNLAFEKYFNVTAQRVNLSLLQEKILRNAYVTGNGVLYTYWNPDLKTGVFADDNKTSEIKGDICCEILDIDDIYFGDEYIEDIQSQPYIIVTTDLPLEQVLKEARIYGADITALRNIENIAENGKVLVLTKFFKEYKKDGSYTIKGVKVCENAVIRGEFDTLLHHYPLSLFKWERKNNSPYGESEITYLIPNQIMLVNGDTVTQKITNEPGQIIKVYGSNEDVTGAVKYLAPPTFSQEYDASIKALIENTLAQSGANAVALGDLKAENNSALRTMREASLMPLTITKNRFYGFIEETARIWADFWVTKYGKRKLRITDSKGYRYIPFDADRYKNYIFNANVEVSSGVLYGDGDRLDTLLNLFEKGVIDKAQLVARLPDGIIADKKQLLNEIIARGDTLDGE